MLYSKEMKKLYLYILSKLVFCHVIQKKKEKEKLGKNTQQEHKTKSNQADKCYEIACGYCLQFCAVCLV